MEQRSRFKKVIHKGYTLGIWHSAFVHHVLLLILFFIVVRSPQVEELGVITLNFSDPKPTLIIEPALKIDFDSISDSVEQSVEGSSSISEILNSEIPKLVAETSEPEKEPEQPMDKFEIADVTPEDLMTEVVEKVEDEKPSVFDKKQSKSKKNQRSGPIASTSSGNALTRMIKAGTKLGDGIPRSLLGMGTTGKGMGSGGKAGDAEARLKFYGAKTGDIQVSLIWNTVDDIDLHVSDGFQIISWKNRRSATGGILDIDMNARGPQNNKPIENIFWPFNTAPRSHYVVAVHFFRAWTNNRSVPVKVRIKTNKGVSYYDVVATRGAGIQQVVQFSN